VSFWVAQSFLDGIDETWQGRVFDGRSEFVRYTLRDATEFPTFDATNSSRSSEPKPTFAARRR
jgi:Arc/MetJ-type ribon-helix-helix transcriptional regulator